MQLNITYHSQKRIQSVFFYVKFPDKGLNQHKNNKHAVYIKLRLTLQSLTTLVIGELLLTANSPSLSDLTI